MMRSVLLAIYPLLKLGLDLSFTRIGLITLTYQFTASLLQTLIGLYTDRRPMPLLPASGHGLHAGGAAHLSQAGSFGAVLLSAMLIGMGSSVFHPGHSRVARMAAGKPAWSGPVSVPDRRQSGIGHRPLLAALIIVPKGQGSAAWFSLFRTHRVIVLQLRRPLVSHHAASFHRRMRAMPAPA